MDNVANIYREIMLLEEDYKVETDLNKKNEISEKISDLDDKLELISKEKERKVIK